MIYLIEFILVLPVNLVMAWWHSRLIKAGATIHHGWWAFVYFIPLMGALGWQWDNLASAWHKVAFILACLIGRLIVFNIALNRFRGLPWTYLGTSSITDQIERRLFGARVWLAELVLGVIFVILNFFI